MHVACHRVFQRRNVETTEYGSSTHVFAPLLGGARFAYISIKRDVGTNGVIGRAKNMSLITRRAEERVFGWIEQAIPM
jgi:hypothetical protein